MMFCSLFSVKLTLQRRPIALFAGQARLVPSVVSWFVDQFVAVGYRGPV